MPSDSSRSDRLARCRSGRRGALACLALLALILPRLGLSQAAPPPFVTTDDPRRVRIPANADDQTPAIVLRDGTLIDGTGSPPVANAVVVVRGDRILAAGPSGSVALPSGEYQLLDVSGFYIVPGLIDLHIHLAQQWKADDSQYQDSDAAAALRGARKLAALLDGGITTVRDVGTRNDVAFKLKEAVERRIFEGPRVFWAGKGILATGGHGDELRSGVSEASKGTIHSGGPYARIADGADEWRLAVREQIRQHVDLIKLFAPFSREEVSAAIAEAHAQRFRVTVDAFGQFTTWAIEAGADCIEHTLAMPDAAIAMMAQRDTALVPTLTTYHAGGLPPGGYYHDLHRSFEMTHAGNLRIVRAAHAAGVRIGIGTDMGFAGERHYPASYFTEAGFLRDAGLTDAEVLSGATRVAADILGMADKLGTLEQGKLADVLVVRGNPLADLRNLRNLVLLLADGRVVRDRRAALGVAP